MTPTSRTRPNERHPSADLTAEGKNIADLIAAVVTASGTSDDPHGYGNTVARVLSRRTAVHGGTPASYGFAGINGRALADNAPEVMFSLVLNTAITAGLTPSVSQGQRTAGFPYVVPA